VGVGGHDADQAVAYQREGGLACIRPVRARDRLGVHLGERALAQLMTQAEGVVERGVGAALGMGHENAEAPVAQLAGGGVEGLGDRVEGRLDQQPAGARGALGQGVELGLGETPHHVVSQLASLVQLDSDALRAGRGPQLGNPLAKIGDLGDHV